MASIDESILKAAKEIVVKFIECGRLSPSGFADTFESIYKSVDETVKRRQTPVEREPAAAPPAAPKKSQGPGKRS